VKREKVAQTVRTSRLVHAFLVLSRITHHVPPSY